MSRTLTALFVFETFNSQRNLLRSSITSLYGKSQAFFIVPIIAILKIERLDFRPHLMGAGIID